MYLNELKLWGRMFENAFQSLEYADDQDKLDFLKKKLSDVDHRMVVINVTISRLEDNAPVIQYALVSGGLNSDPDRYYVPGRNGLMSEQEFQKEYLKIKRFRYAIPRVGNKELVQKILKLERKCDDLIRARNVLAPEVKVLTKQVTQAFKHSSAEDVAKQLITDTSKIPEKIYWTKKNKFDNPYWSNPKATSAYAGTPEHYHDWTPIQMKHYKIIVDALTRNGYSRPNVMYAARYPSGNHDINFAIIGTDGKFIWRRYGTGAGLQNWLYINGHKMNTTTFTGASPVHQDSYLQPLKAEQA